VIKLEGKTDNHFTLRTDEPLLVDVQVQDGALTALVFQGYEDGSLLGAFGPDSGTGSWAAGNALRVEEPWVVGDFAYFDQCKVLVEVPDRGDEDEGHVRVVVRDERILLEPEVARDIGRALTAAAEAIEEAG